MTTRQHELARAFEVGMLHGIGGRYDCRPFAQDFQAFTLYNEGRTEGSAMWFYWHQANQVGA